MSSLLDGRALETRGTVSADGASRAGGAPPGKAADRGERRRWQVAAGTAYLLLTVVAWVEVNLAAAARDTRPAGERSGWLAAWSRFDSGWYREIALHGYFFQPGKQSPVAFFPTYPLLMRLGGAVGHVDVDVAGVILTLIGGLASVVLFTTWCHGRLSRGATATAVGLLLLYPYSLYLYGAVYADAVFVACAVGAFVLLERGHPWLAGLVGALATAGRPVGVAVVIGLAIRALELAGQRSAQESFQAPDAGPLAALGWTNRVRAARTAIARSVRSLRWSDAGVLVSAGGLAAYMAYQWLAFGNPAAFLATESAPGWDQGTGPRVLFKFAFFYRMLHGNPAQIAQLLLPALLCLGTILLLPRVRRRLGWGYALYTAVVVAMPIYGTKDFMGVGRYLLPAFPAVAALADLMTEKLPRPARRVLLCLSAALLVTALALYGLGFEVS
jgi:hypothetical protein